MLPYYYLRIFIFTALLMWSILGMLILYLRTSEFNREYHKLADYLGVIVYLMGLFFTFSALVLHLLTAYR